MPVTSLHLRGSTRVERHAAVDIVEESIRATGGWIVDFQEFSNNSLVLEVEVPPRRLDQLVQLLCAGSICLDEKPALAPGEEDDAVLATVHVAFVHDEADRREAPSQSGGAAGRKRPSR